MNLFDYVDRVAIIHLPHQTHRFESISRELKRIGGHVGDPKVRIPDAPRPFEADGFPSRGVRGNFLSHLGILRDALADNLQVVLVLEDDAIFSNCMRSCQQSVVEFLHRNDWDLCYFGHSLTKKSLGGANGMITLAPGVQFMWAHCYAVRAGALKRLVAHLERAVILPAGHPEGGRLYIDGAFSLFRRFNPDIVTFASSPALSIQMGTPSNLGSGRWYDGLSWLRPMIAWGRGARDLWWRISSGSPAAFARQLDRS